MKARTAFLLMAAAIVMAAVACRKTVSTNASVLFYNGSWTASNIRAAWNGIALTITPVTQGQSSGTAEKPYLDAPAGTSLVNLQAGLDTLVNKNIYTAAATSSTFLFYDTTAMVIPGARVNVLQLTDDLSLPDTAMIKYRLIDLAPDPADIADVWLVNGATDSVRLDSAFTFIGAAAQSSTVQPFLPLSYHNENYTLKIKKTGTETVLASIPQVNFMVRGIYSIIFSGISSNTGAGAVRLSLLHHNIP